MCNDDATTTKRWAPFSPPDEIDVVDAALPVSWVLVTIWARGRAPRGRVEGVVGTLLIVELGSLGFLGKHDGCAVGCDGGVRIDQGGRWDGVIRILNKQNLCPLYRP